MQYLRYASPNDRDCGDGKWDIAALEKCRHGSKQLPVSSARNFKPQIDCTVPYKFALTVVH